MPPLWRGSERICPPHCRGAVLRMHVMHGASMFSASELRRATTKSVPKVTLQCLVLTFVVELATF